jgi:hypothetical protein
MIGNPDVHAMSLQCDGPHFAGNVQFMMAPQPSSVVPGPGNGQGTDVGTSPLGVCESAITFAKDVYTGWKSKFHSVPGAAKDASPRYPLFSAVGQSVAARVK